MLSGQTEGAWVDVSSEFERLRQLDPEEAAARVALARTRAFIDCCATISANPAARGARPPTDPRVREHPDPVPEG